MLQAYRAKNIKNKPEINQRVTKTALIKDLNEEIDKLKSELFATREKNGVYLDAARYEKEQKEAKEMRELEGLLEVKQAELANVTGLFEAEQAKFNELTEKHTETTRELSETQTNLKQTEEDLDEAKVDIEERDFLLDEREKAEHALVSKASELESELGQAVADGSGLFGKVRSIFSPVSIFKDALNQDCVSGGAQGQGREL